MTRLSASGLYVTTYGNSIDFDTIYTDRAEAASVSAALAAAYPTLEHRVLTLDDAIYESTRDARYEGEYNERNQDNY